MYYSLISSMNRVLSSTDFIMTIDTTKAGSASNSFNLRIGTTGAIPNTGTVYWGDGTSDLCSSFVVTGITHVYPSSGVYDVKIEGQFQGIRYVGAGDFNKLIEVKQWGSSLFEFMQFSLTANMTITATDIPNTTNITSFSGSFNASGITTIPNINQWDWSNITSCSTMFYLASSLLTLDLSGIDLSSCTNFGTSTATGMFRNNTLMTSLNCHNWTLSPSNTTMAVMFRNVADDVITGLDTWNIEKVTSLASFLIESKVTTAEYNALLISWDSQDAVNSLAVNFGTSQYTLASASAIARAGLISNDLWTITDGGGI